MKFFTYTITCILLIAFLGLFILKKPNGETWLSLGDLLPQTSSLDHQIDTLNDKFSKLYDKLSKTDNHHQSELIKIYRWQDGQGNWSYSDSPTNVSESEEVFINPNDMIVLPDLTETHVNSVKALNTDKKTSEPLLTRPINKILTLYEDTNNVQALMDAREQQISQAIHDNKK
jgi:hypothetical protein